MTSLTPDLLRRVEARLQHQQQLAPTPYDRLVCSLALACVQVKLVDLTTPREPAPARVQRPAMSLER